MTQTHSGLHVFDLWLCDKTRVAREDVLGLRKKLSKLANIEEAAVSSLALRLATITDGPICCGGS